MRVSRWCSVVRLIGFVLLVLASCPFTAPFKPVDLAMPVDGGPLGAAAFIQAKGAVDDPTAAPAPVPAVFTLPAVPSVGSLLRLRPAPAATLLHVPLRI
jgi:hypothetical protein